MSLFEAIVLGIIQGITEFAPLSSSAHLVIVPYFFGWRQPLLFFLVMLHLGSLVGVFCYFRRELLQLFLAFARSVRKLSVKNDPLAKLFWLIILGTVPAAFAGHFLRGFFENLFKTPLPAGFFLLLTGVFLILSEKAAKQARDLENIAVSDSLLIGLAQSFAIAPGISRSGLTIAAGLFMGLTRESSARFSFLLSVPVILGVFVEEITKLNLAVKTSNFAPLVLGFLAAAISGYSCIKYLLRYLQKGKLSIFAYYCFGLGILTIIFNWLVPLKL
jgi:undecaprenyl-diphosphatase